MLVLTGIGVVFCSFGSTMLQAMSNIGVWRCGYILSTGLDRIQGFGGGFYNLFGLRIVGILGVVCWLNWFLEV